MDFDELKAEDLLVRNWEHLKYTGIFVQAALFVGTERCRSLVAAAVQESPEPKRLFTFLGSHWQMGGRPRSADSRRLDYRLFSRISICSMTRVSTVYGKAATRTDSLIGGVSV